MVSFIEATSRPNVSFARVSSALEVELFRLESKPTMWNCRGATIDGLASTEEPETGLLGELTEG
jgi:hypothetical protein